MIAVMAKISFFNLATFPSPSLCSTFSWLSAFVFASRRIECYYPLFLKFLNQRCHSTKVNWIYFTNGEVSTWSFFRQAWLWRSAYSCAKMFKKCVKCSKLFKLEQTTCTVVLKLLHVTAYFGNANLIFIFFYFFFFVNAKIIQSFLRRDL